MLRAAVAVLLGQRTAAEQHAELTALVAAVWPAEAVTTADRSTAAR